MKAQALLGGWLKNHPAVVVSIIWIVAIIVLRLFAVGALKYSFGGAESSVSYGLLTRGAVHFDSKFYLSLAANGYFPGTVWIVFYPVFPFLIRLIHEATTLNLIRSALLINTVCVVFAAQGIYRLTEIVSKNRQAALYATIAWLVFPSAHFLLAAYSESLYCAVSVWAFVWLLEKRYWPAFLLAGLASGVRFPGVIVSLSVVFGYLQSQPWENKKFDYQMLLLPLAGSGILIYWTWIMGSTGELPWVAISKAYAAGWPYMTLSWDFIPKLFEQFTSLLGHDNKSSQSQFVIGWLVILASAILGWIKKLPLPLVLYAAGTALLLILPGNFISHSRYALPVWPIFILLGIWLAKANEIPRLLYFVFSAMTLAIMLALFANGYWVG